MTLPTPWTIIEVYGQSVDKQGNPNTGTITFVMLQPLVVNSIEVTKANLIAVLDDTGSFTAQLPATDDPNVAPQGTAYMVYEQYATGLARPPYAIAVTYTAAGGRLNLFEIAPLVPPPDLVSTIGPRGYSLYTGTGAPSNGIGNDGDTYIDAPGGVVYGPKAGGVWPTPGTVINQAQAEAYAAAALASQIAAAASQADADNAATTATTAATSATASAATASTAATTASAAATTATTEAGIATTGATTATAQAGIATTGATTATAQAGIATTQATNAAASAASSKAITTTTANFTQPAVNATVSVSVANTAWMSVGQVIYISTGGYYSVSSITSGLAVVLTNLGATGNASPAATINSGSSVGAGGVPGANGTSLNRPSATLTPSAGVATINVTTGAEVYILTLAANVTSWVFNNLPSAGTIAEIRIKVIQATGGTQYTCVSPATAGNTAGGAWVNSSAAGAIESIGLAIDSSGTVAVFPSGVYA